MQRYDSKDTTPAPGSSFLQEGPEARVGAERVERRLCVAFQHIRKIGKRLIGRRGFSLLARGRRPIRVSYLLPRVLVFVTVETQQFPVAPIGWIVVVVMVPVMDRKLAKLLAAEFATAPRTDPGIYLERLLPIGIGPLIAVVYCPRVLGQWFDGIRFYAAASSPTRSRRTWAGLR